MTCFFFSSNQCLRSKQINIKTKSSRCHQSHLSKSWCCVDEQQQPASYDEQVTDPNSQICYCENKEDPINTFPIWKYSTLPGCKCIPLFNLGCHKDRQKAQGFFFCILVQTKRTTADCSRSISGCRNVSFWESSTHFVLTKASHILWIRLDIFVHCCPNPV